MEGIIERLLSLSPEELKKLPRRRPNKGYRRRKRPKRTKEQLADYLRQKGFKTRDQLRAGRDEGDPTDTDYRNAWGSWTEAVDEIWGNTFDRLFVVKSLIEFKLWTVSKYRAKAHEHPDIFPSMRIIYREFGSWEALKMIARATSLKKTLEDYIELKKCLGRRPTQEDCKTAGIVLEKAIKIHGSKRAFDTFVNDLEGIA